MNEQFQRVVDFFDQLSDIWQQIINFMYSKDTLDDNGVTLSDLINTWTTNLNNTIGGYVHPYFVPFIAFAIVIACAHKLLKWTSKE